MGNFQGIQFSLIGDLYHFTGLIFMVDYPQKLHLVPSKIHDNIMVRVDDHSLPPTRDWLYAREESTWSYCIVIVGKADGHSYDGQ